MAGDSVEVFSGSNGLSLDTPFPTPGTRVGSAARCGRRVEAVRHLRVRHRSWPSGQWVGCRPSTAPIGRLMSIWCFLLAIPAMWVVCLGAGWWGGVASGTLLLRCVTSALHRT